MITKQSAFLQNRATILEFLYRNPATSRTDIVNETGLTPKLFLSQIIFRMLLEVLK
ncbi:ROK family protein [Streptococcus pneumoniae]|nr:ROK family protein [Streptococcus pneumoniae]